MRDAEAVSALLRRHHNVLLSMVRVQGKIVGTNTYQETLSAVIRAGTLLTFLQEIIYGDENLPEGAIPHIRGAESKLIGNKITALLKDYADVFPVELPKQ